MKNSILFLFLLWLASRVLLDNLGIRVYFDIEIVIDFVIG